jgi:3-deoxy-D-manno-octulosonic-acid transferase
MVSALTWILDLIQTRFPLRLLGVRPARSLGFNDSSWKQVQVSANAVTWFHAASLGELEMLRPLIDDFIESGEVVGLSVFSDSALPGLSDLRSKCIYAGLSPRERDWGPLFHHFRVRKLVLAKYDFWPGMIKAAGASSIPVILINAQDRRSLHLIRWLFAFSSLPRFFFFRSSPDSNSDALVEFRAGVDPRWERAARRAFGQNASAEKRARIQEWKSRISGMRHPVGVLGSAWKEDLDIILPAMETFPGALLVVPHSLAPENLRVIRERISGFPKDRIDVVAEVGILAELYGEADFAFVGGGFGKGIHSTIEPAVFGIPVAVGPNRVGDFPETRELRERGQLTVVRNPAELSLWLGSTPLRKKDPGFLDGKRTRYRALLEECLGIR